MTTAALAKHQSSPRRPITNVAAMLTVLLPVGYVALTPLWFAVSVTALLVLVAAGALTRRMWGPLPQMQAVFAGLGILVVVSATSTGTPDALIFVAPLAAGLVAGTSIRHQLTRLLVGIVVFLAASCAAEYLHGSLDVSTWFGTSYRPRLFGAEFRARGLIGQPVPTAVCAVSAGMAAVVTLRGRPWLIGVLAVLMSACVFATGSRSGLLLLLSGAGLLASSAVARRRFASRGAAKAVIALGVVAAFGFALWPVISSSILGNRALSFSDLAGTDSLDNRLHGGAIFEYWSSNCDAACKTVGSGPRSLQEFLLGGLGFNGLSTIDNLWLTVLWDFGVIGFLLLVIAAVAAFRVAFSRTSSDTAAAGAIAVLMLSLSGAFFDTLYTPGLAALFGLGLAWMLAADAPDGPAARRPTVTGAPR